jgi:hypothetical protein
MPRVSLSLECQNLLTGFTFASLKVKFTLFFLEAWTGLEEGGSMEPVKVVVRYSSGKVVKGFTQDFLPNKDPSTSIQPKEPQEKQVRFC